MCQVLLLKTVIHVLRGKHTTCASKPGCRPSVTHSYTDQCYEPRRCLSKALRRYGVNLTKSCPRFVLEGWLVKDAKLGSRLAAFKFARPQARGSSKRWLSGTHARARERSHSVLA